MNVPPPTGPTHFIRTHSSSISALSFSDDNERLYSGDASGVVVVTSTRSLRAITSWNAHTDALLGVEEWDNRIITHAKDNKLHVWTRVVELPASRRLGAGSAVVAASSHSDLVAQPTLCFSMDVNALNFCRFSFLKPNHGHRGQENDALIALPNLVDSEVADVWSLATRERIHAAIGQAGKKSSSVFSTPIGERSKTGIIMALHLFTPSREAVPEPSSSSSKAPADELRLLCAYENGGVTLRRYSRTDERTSVEGMGWDVIWDVKLHVESIMAMKVSRTNELALTVSADHLIARYDLTSKEPSEKACTAYRTKHPGNTAITIRDDGRLCAVAGWDGHIRLYATRTLKPLGTLKYHKTGCQCVVFARSITTVREDDSGHEGDHEDGDSEDELSYDDKLNRTRWLAAGGKDHRVSIWALMSFDKG